MAPLVVITGTGTGIGKTYVATLFVRAWSRQLGAGRILGLKPIETGGQADGTALGRASTFHVTRITPPYLFTDPVSPHLAARREGRSIDVGVVADWVGQARAAQGVDGVVVELAGGLYSPLSDAATNADVVRHLHPTATVLVAPDRLGVLHDVLSTTTAARAFGIELAGLLLSAPEHADSSTGTNAAELARILPSIEVLAALKRGASVDALMPAVERVLVTPRAERPPTPL
jgi:dethiobiotin synthetase